MSIPSRVKAGVPTGGQFAAGVHGESDISLGAGTGQSGRVERCRSCYGEFNSAQALAGHECEALEELTGAEFELLATKDAWEGRPCSNNNHAYNIRYAAAAADIVAHFPSAPGFHLHNGTAPPQRTGEMYEARTGAKYTGHRDRASIAKDIRADLKFAQEKGFLPSSMAGRPITYAVTSGGGSINIRINGMSDEDHYEQGHRRPPHGDRIESGTARDVYARVDNLAHAYNRSRTEAQSDYFDETYYAFVRIPNERDQAWEAHDKEQTKGKAQISKMISAGEPTDRIEKAMVAWRSANDRYLERDRAYGAAEEAAAAQWCSIEAESEARRVAAIAARAGR